MASKDERGPGRVRVTVNNHGVSLPAGRLAGLEIKQEAAAQGAELEVGFQFSVREGGRYLIVADEEVIAVREGQEFLAVTTDDHA
jgi:hypothetical protein